MGYIQSPKLLRSDKSMLFITHNNRRQAIKASNALHSHLQHRELADEWQKLLRVQLPR